MEVDFNVFQSMRKLNNICLVSISDIVDEESYIVPTEVRHCVESLEAVIVNIKVNNINEYARIVSIFAGMGFYSYSLKKLKLVLKE